MKKSRKQIVIVDDDSDYTYIMEEAIHQFEPCPDIKVLHQAPDLLTWLETSQRPDLIFLDVNMPATNGFELLRALKTDEKYKSIPVIMLTVSEDGEDIRSSYELGANAFMTKPMSFNQLVPQMEALRYFWFDTALLPRL